MARGTCGCLNCLIGVKRTVTQNRGHSAARVWPEGETRAGPAVRAAKLSNRKHQAGQVDDIVLDARTGGRAQCGALPLRLPVANDDPTTARAVRHRARRGIVFATAAMRDSAFRVAEPPALGSVATVYARAWRGNRR
jgi:hypothetical protein